MPRLDDILPTDQTEAYVMPFKTEQELWDLKVNWRTDPCWDLEYTEGFERYQESLRTWRLETEAGWAQDIQSEREFRAETFGCTVKLVKVIELLESRIVALERNMEVSRVD